MLVELKKMGERPTGEMRFCERPVEILHSADMKPEEFAFKYASALLSNPRLNSEESGYYVGNMAVFAVIFGEDPTEWRGQSNSVGADHSHTPQCVRMQIICDGKLAQVTIGPNAENTHHFFRISEDGLKWLPYGENCRVITSNNTEVAVAPEFIARRNDPAWPWVALYPEKFAGLIEFADILNPNDENPLTGLVSTKDAPVRTLAKQIVRQLETARDNWIRDIVDSL